MTNYGMAGCGFATTWVSRNSLGPQLGVTTIRSTPATTVIAGLMLSNAPLMALGNAIAWAIFPPFAMTSGTSNCVPNNPKMARYTEQKFYIVANYHDIKKEIARGSGEHIDALISLMECANQGSNAFFVSLVQEHYDRIFEDKDLEISAHNMLQLAYDNHHMGSSCQAVII